MHFKITLHEIEQTEKKFIHFGFGLTLPYKITRRRKSIDKSRHNINVYTVELNNMLLKIHLNT